MKKVGIIGGSGFIDSDIVSLFLNHLFDVKVSTADILKKENYQHLMELEHTDNLYVCELNATITTDLNDFTKECDYVVIANPKDFNFNK